MSRKVNKSSSETKKILKKACAIFLSLAIIFSLILVYDNFYIDVDIYKFESKKTQVVNGLKIAHISDYHNRKTEVINTQIFNALDEQNPDVIFITGDIIDKNKTDVDTAIDFCEKLCKYAPVYYVTGNHECNLSIVNQSGFDNMLQLLKSVGVNVLRQECASFITENGDKVNIYGIDDQYFHCEFSTEVTETTRKLCSKLEINKDEFNILLAHQPEQISVYADFGFDLVFSGHAHGGQVRFFNQGIIAPDQGFFPEYTSGEYVEGETTMYLSRGIGNSVVPVRVFNKSNIIFVEV